MSAYQIAIQFANDRPRHPLVRRLDVAVAVGELTTVSLSIARFLSAATRRARFAPALAHVNSDRVEAACRRSDLFERRRTLMQQWADYLAATP